ncbi:MAG: DUF5662 family protein [Clostridia bacterium]|nr:DUF5662 family protein [Clostridia bacterium]
MGNAYKHFCTIMEHKRYVRQACFKMGLYWQGITHDLSKLSPAEFLVSIKYFNGKYSPNNDERRDIGYSSAWLHHQGRNKHHFEYWVDYSTKTRGERTPVKMPLKYVAEMVADRYAACRTYNKEAYTCKDPLDYFVRGKANRHMHVDTGALLEKVLTIMAESGEDAAFAYVKQLLKENNEY